MAGSIGDVGKGLYGKLLKPRLFSYPNFLGENLRRDGIVDYHSNQSYFDSQHSTEAGHPVGVFDTDRGAMDNRMKNLEEKSDPFIMFEFIKIDHNKGDDSGLGEKFVEYGGKIINLGKGDGVVRKFDTSQMHPSEGVIKSSADSKGDSLLDKAIETASNITAENAKDSIRKAFQSWRPKKISGDTIVLYMTPAINIAESVNYHEDTRMLASALEGYLESEEGWLNSLSASDATTLAVTSAAAIGGIVGNVLGKTISTVLGGSLGDAIKGEAEIRRGKTRNPNEYIRYQNTALRNFNFDFKFLPDTPEESVTCKNIIKSFRQNMHAHKESDLTIQVPSTCIVSFHGIKDIIQLPPLVVNNVTTTYGPTGATRFAEDKRPVEMNFSVGLQEIQPIYEQDVIAGY